jgi:hypothetical protein
MVKVFSCKRIINIMQELIRINQVKREAPSNSEQPDEA